MSEIRLNVCDVHRKLHGTIHASRVDYVVAALSADPETIEELQTALARFLPASEQRSFFAGWRVGHCMQPWDAGLAYIDLAARLVAIESSYSMPGPRGSVAMTDPNKDSEVMVDYHVAEDWLFTQSIDGCEALAEQRRNRRRAASPLDARPPLYDQVCEYIARVCWTACSDMSAESCDKEAARKAISAIHARWLITPRDDLDGLAPRDVLLARRDQLTWDLQHRALQWSMLGACPPGLSPESAAYKFGGFGTHEIVVYYDLVRTLIWNCWERTTNQRRAQMTEQSTEQTRDLLAAEVCQLQAVRDDWLSTPDFEEFSGRTPASIIARERARLPEGVTGAEAMVDDDCPLCQMMADDPHPMFWNLDGCNMDDDFAFSFHRTYEEWETERREWDEYSRKCEENRQSGEATTESVWKTSFVDPELMGESPTMALFGIGSHLAELTQNLKDAHAEQATIDDLNRWFGNLRDAAQDPAAALLEPTVAKMCDTLATVAESFTALTDQCADLERQLNEFGRELADEPWGDEEMPF